MKTLLLSERHGWSRCVVQQIYYSLAAREAEWELLRVSRDEGVGTLIWSPLAFGLLSGKFRRGAAMPEGARAAVIGGPGKVSMERVYAIVDVLEAIAGARGVSVAQVAMNYILYKPQVDSVLIGARNEQQLKDNLAALAWRLSDEELKRLDEVSYQSLPYPYWHQAVYGPARNPTYAGMYKG
jgi:aryl-alcohol dehydrogenase-like predicted oxidoreductase